MIGVEGGNALIRCSTLHDTPLRLPAGLVSKVADGDETERHERFRVEAACRGEL